MKKQKNCMINPDTEFSNSERIEDFFRNYNLRPFVGFYVYNYCYTHSLNSHITTQLKTATIHCSIYLSVVPPHLHF